MNYKQEQSDITTKEDQGELKATVPPAGRRDSCDSFPAAHEPKLQMIPVHQHVSHSCQCYLPQGTVITHGAAHDLVRI